LESVQNRPAAGLCHAKNTCTTHRRRKKALEAAEELMDFLEERYPEAMELLDNAKDDIRKRPQRNNQ